jgi:cytochrome P450
MSLILVPWNSPVIYTYTVAMLRYPEVMRKAQAEIDSVVGDQFPTFKDAGSLPYIEALIKEVTRLVVCSE